MTKAPVIIYDGECPVCIRTIAWIRDHSRPESFAYLPCRSAERKERFPGMAEEVCMEAIQAVLPDGRILSGEEALPEIVARLEGIEGAADLFSLPGAEVLTRSFYRWFARNRYDIARILFPKKDANNNGDGG